MTPRNPPAPSSAPRRRLPVGLAVAALALLAGALLLLKPWPKRRAAHDLNVILVTIDTLRADYVSAYETGRAETPALDGLAASGVRFDHCVAQAPLTLPSHTTILSATYPLFHRVRDNGAFRVPQGLTLLSEVLRERGFHTAAFIGGYVLHGRWGLNRGFDLYADRFAAARDARLRLDADKPAGVVLGEARRWLDGIGKRRFFAWIHLYDPHFPYTPPPPFDRRCAGDPYRGEVEYADAELGRFIAYLKETGRYDKTLIVVAADHGEGLNDHGEQKHGYFVYETTVRVPLIVRAPAGFASARVAQTVQLVDVAPTILDLLAIPAPGQWQGHSLCRLMDGQADDRFGTAYSETWYPRLHFGWSPLQAFYDGRDKYIFAPRDELYDLHRDPGETRDQAAGQPRRRADLRARGLAFAQRYGRGALEPGQAGTLSADERRRLAALGYLTGTVREPAAGPLADPKDKLADYVAFGRAVTLLGEKRWSETLTAARALVAANPEFAGAWSLLGSASRGLDQHEQALAAFRRSLQLKPDDSVVRQEVLGELQALGRSDEAAREADAFLRGTPDDAGLLAEYGQIRLRQGRREEGLALLKRAMAADPDTLPAVQQSAELLIGRRDYAAAQGLLEEALRVDPRAKNCRYLLAQIAEANGQTAAAADWYRQELADDPTHVQAAFNLANTLKQAGRGVEAERFYRLAIAAAPDLKLAYLHLADILLQRRGDLREAVDLCLKGIALPPRDRDTLFGYFLLTNLYAALGDDERRLHFTREGEKLIATLGAR